MVIWNNISMVFSGIFTTLGLSFFPEGGVMLRLGLG